MRLENFSWGGSEVWVNEAIIHFEFGFAEFEGRKTAMSILGYPGCIQGTIQYTRVKSRPQGRLI